MGTPALKAPRRRDPDPGVFAWAGPVLRHVQAVMGTMVSFEIRIGDAEAKAAHVALARACSRLERADAVFSTWKPNSPMSLLRRGEMTLGEAPAEMAEVLELCKVARELSGGCFDPWAMPGGIDPTGLVKGWAADRALGELRAAGVRAATVNAGGDLASFGGPGPGWPWRIGVRDPRAESALACVVESPGAVATSGCYERGPHLINPKDGKMRFETASASVVGADLAICDALATALVVADEEGPELARTLADYDAYLIRSDGTEHASTGIMFATESVR